MANPDPETIVKEAKTVAVVGLSSNPEKASNEVGAYLKEQGYRIVPVNPNEEEVLGSALTRRSSRYRSRWTSWTCFSLPRRPPRSPRTRFGPAPGRSGCRRESRTRRHAG